MTDKMTNMERVKLITKIEVLKIEVGFYKEFLARTGLQEQYINFLLEKEGILDDRDF